MCIDVDAPVVLEPENTVEPLGLRIRPGPKESLYEHSRTDSVLSRHHGLPRAVAVAVGVTDDDVAGTHARQDGGDDGFGRGPRIRVQGGQIPLDGG